VPVRFEVRFVCVYVCVCFQTILFSCEQASSQLASASRPYAAETRSLRLNHQPYPINPTPVGSTLPYQPYAINPTPLKQNSALDMHVRVYVCMCVRVYSVCPFVFRLYVCIAALNCVLLSKQAVLVKLINALSKLSSVIQSNMCVGLAGIEFLHRIRPYIWLFPSQKYRAYTVYIYMIMANPMYVCQPPN
jgi:hypothetical protein